LQHITFRHWIGVKSDSFFGTLYADFKPFFDTYLEKYDNWKIAQGLSKGETSQLSLYFNEFVEKLRAWDAIVQVVFLEKTPNYRSIFPSGKSIFYHGTFEQRVEQLSALAGRLGKFAALAALKTEITNYYKLVHDELIAHQNNQTIIKISSKELEAARIAIGQMLYGNLGLLMNHYKIDSEQISSFFPLDIIRAKKKNQEDSPNNVYTLLLIAKEIKEAGLSFDATTKFLIFNNGNAEIGIYTTSAKDSPPPATPKFKLQPNEEKECTLVDLGAFDDRYMFVVNLDDNEEAEIEISIL